MVWNTAQVAMATTTISDPILISSVAQFCLWLLYEPYYCYIIAAVQIFYLHFVKHNCGCMNVIPAVCFEGTGVAWSIERAKSTERNILTLYFIEYIGSGQVCNCILHESTIAYMSAVYYCCCYCWTTTLLRIFCFHYFIDNIAVIACMPLTISCVSSCSASTNRHVLTEIMWLLYYSVTTSIVQFRSNSTILVHCHWHGFASIMYLLQMWNHFPIFLPPTPLLTM